MTDRLGVFGSRVTVGGSLDGGLLELRLLSPSFSSSAAMRAISLATSASNSAMRSSRGSRGTPFV
jgi:hypothetical protein